MTQAPQGASTASDRGAQRASARLAAGASAVTVVTRSAAYSRATGASVVFIVDTQSAIYK
ncbi:hypothetical protein BN903_85 [Halorubrum sp. AJ67]|nr:hypothetical protein BN903_85 [Halorubrum sp. AJ67]